MYNLKTYLQHTTIIYRVRILYILSVSKQQNELVVQNIFLNNKMKLKQFT